MPTACPVCGLDSPAAFAGCRRPDCPQRGGGFPCAIPLGQPAAALPGEGQQAWTCPACQAPVAAADRRCARCGQALIGPCPNCWAEGRVGQGSCPGCGLDWDRHFREDLHWARAGEALEAALGERPLPERCAQAEKALQEWLALKALLPDDAEAGQQAEQARQLAARLLEQAGLDALKGQRLAEATGLFGRLVRVQPGHALAVRRLGEIRRARAARLGEAHTAWQQGKLKQAVEILTRLEANFPGDAEIAPLLEQGRKQAALLEALAREELPRLKEQRRFVEMAERLRRAAEAGPVPDWVTKATRRVRDRLDRLAPSLAEARGHLDAGRPDLAAALAGEVLSSVADHPEALALMEQAEGRARAVGPLGADLQAALDQRRWFRAALLLERLARPGVGAQAPEAVRARVEQGVLRAQTYGRLLAWAVGGAGLWWLAGVPAELLAGGLSAVGLPAGPGLSLFGLGLFGAVLVLVLTSAIRRSLNGRAVTGAVLLALAGLALAAPPLVPLAAAALGRADVPLGSPALRWGVGCALGTALFCLGFLRATNGLLPESAVGKLRPGRALLAGGLAAFAGLAPVVWPGMGLAYLPAGAALAGGLALLGLAWGRDRYVLCLLAALLAGLMEVGASRQASAEMGRVAAGCALLLLAGAAAMSARPLGFGRTLIAVALAAGLTALFRWRALPPLVGAALALWLVLAGQAVVALRGCLDLRPHLPARLRYWLSRQPAPPEDLDLEAILVPGPDAWPGLPARQGPASPAEAATVSWQEGPPPVRRAAVPASSGAGSPDAPESEPEQPEAPAVFRSFPLAVAAVLGVLLVCLGGVLLLIGLGRSDPGTGGGASPPGGKPAAPARP